MARRRRVDRNDFTGGEPVLVRPAGPPETVVVVTERRRFTQRSRDGRLTVELIAEPGMFIHTGADGFEELLTAEQLESRHLIFDGADELGPPVGGGIGGAGGP